MKRIIQAALFACILTLAGCGEDDWGYYYYPYPPPPYFAEFLSNPGADGYIAKDPVTGAFTVTQGMSATIQSVFVGTNPTTGATVRGFLDFPGSVPGGAFINSAVLNIFIDAIQTPTGTIPVRIDLVAAPPPLVETDFDSTALATVSTTLFQSDLGQYVDIDVTPLLAQAQLLHFTDFQIRILLPTSPGFVEIDDTTGADRGQLAPLLTVTYS